LFAVDLDPIFHLPTGQQRGIGESMIIADSTDEGRRWRCIGFAEFRPRLDNEPSFSAWFERLERSIVEYAKRPEQDNNRLVELNRRLTELSE
jgi:hypothetical protein